MPPPGEDDEGGRVAATFGSWEIDAENDEVAILKHANGETSLYVGTAGDEVGQDFSL
jgi:hypothetical protein